MFSYKKVFLQNDEPENSGYLKTLDGQYIFLREEIKENKGGFNMNLFIAGVGDVELFRYLGTQKQSVLVSKTLVDSSINLSVSLEDIRAGQGAKLYGRYAHSSGMTMKLTDAMFRMDFLAANVGEDTVLGGSAVETTANAIKVAADGTVDISGFAPQKIYPEAKKIVIWAALKGSTDFSIIEIEDNADLSKVSVAPTFAKDDEICIRYIKENAAGETLTIPANFIPDTLVAVLTAPLFAGGTTKDGGASTKVGKLTITIPRFMLNGTTDLSMSMTGASQMTLEGSALAVESENCEEEGYYAIISKVLTDDKITDGLKKIGVAEFDDRASALAYPLIVMGFYAGIGAKQIPSTAVEVEGEKVLYNKNTGMLSLDTGAASTAITVTVKMAEDPTIQDTFEIPAE